MGKYIVLYINTHSKHATKWHEIITKAIHYLMYCAWAREYYIGHAIWRITPSQSIWKQKMINHGATNTYVYTSGHNSHLHHPYRLLTQTQYNLEVISTIVSYIIDLVHLVHIQVPHNMYTGDIDKYRSSSSKSFMTNSIIRSQKMWSWKRRW